MEPEHNHRRNAENCGRLVGIYRSAHDSGITGKDNESSAQATSTASTTLPKGPFQIFNLRVR